VYGRLLNSSFEETLSNSYQLIYISKWY